MEASELDKAVTYTKQFIEAATPIAKQAYEIGLITLRIDAAQALVFSFLGLIVSFFVIRRLRADWAEAKKTAALPQNAQNVWTRDAGDHLPADGMAHFFAATVALMGGFICALNVTSIWLWTKLFAPEFWLARQAVRKLID